MTLYNIYDDDGDFVAGCGMCEVSSGPALYITGMPPGSDHVFAPCGRYFFREFESRPAPVEISFSVPCETSSE